MHYVCFDPSLETIVTAHALQLGVRVSRVCVCARARVCHVYVCLSGRMSSFKSRFVTRCLGEPDYLDPPMVCTVLFCNTPGTDPLYPPMACTVLFCNTPGNPPWIRLWRVPFTFVIHQGTDPWVRLWCVPFCFVMHRGERPAGVRFRRN
jgi:hypothetical protein